MNFTVEQKYQFLINRECKRLKCTPAEYDRLVQNAMLYNDKPDSKHVHEVAQ